MAECACGMFTVALLISNNILPLIFMQFVSKFFLFMNYCVVIVLMFMCSLQGNRSAANLRKYECPDYPSLQQLFAPSTATGNLQISSNTPPLNSDEERALEEEIANANITDASPPTHLDNDYYTPNFESFRTL